MAPLPIGGYVLAGGRSSRMGTDKALLQLAGKPLIAHAVAKLRGLCAEVTILGANPALAAYAPLLGDTHPGCGPIGGMEAALKHSPHAWCLFLAVDMPFLPGAFMQSWMARWAQEEDDAARIRLFTADARPQPGFCLLHRDVLPFLSEGILRGDFKLMRVFDGAARELALRNGVATESVLWSRPFNLEERSLLPGMNEIASAQLAARPLWFANLNTPEDFAVAEEHLAALDA
jgi:molybdopterin-guanine dinucleotide biosynthesis protein A